MKAQSKLINKNKQIKVNDTTASKNTQEYKLLLNMFKISYEKYRLKLYYLFDQILYCLYVFRIFLMSWWPIPRFRDHHIVEDLRKIWILYGGVTHHFRRTVNGVKRCISDSFSVNTELFYCTNRVNSSPLAEWFCIVYLLLSGICEVLHIIKAMCLMLSKVFKPRFVLI